LLADALNETVVMTIDGQRRTITKREAIVTQMVDKSASADLRATKMLIDTLKINVAMPR
jgi:16S rRNA C1402 (ribose-2'-O) methylase RsmI